MPEPKSLAVWIPYRAHCYLCGREDCCLVVRLPCPHCAATVPVRLCRRCAKRLLHDLAEILVKIEKLEIDGAPSLPDVLGALLGRGSHDHEQAGG